MTNLKAFRFSGFGNFSASFGWDNGLDCSLGELIAAKCHDELNMFRGVEQETINEHGGSRNVDGYVVARSRRDARKLLREYSERFDVVEYERD